MKFVLKKLETFQISNKAHWSSGMIPPLGGGGPGFNSQMSPTFLFFYFDFLKDIKPILNQYSGDKSLLFTNLEENDDKALKLNIFLQKIPRVIF